MAEDDADDDADQVDLDKTDTMTGTRWRRHHDSGEDPHRMTQAHALGPAPVPPFAAMLRATMIPMVATVPVIVALFWITGQSRGGLAALLGASIAVAFFAGGLYVMGRVTNANPLSVLAGALAVYLGQVIFLGVVIFTFSGADWLDGKAFGLSVLAVALIWQVCQVVAFMRLRQPVFDQQVAEPADESAQGRRL